MKRSGFKLQVKYSLLFIFSQLNVLVVIMNILDPHNETSGETQEEEEPDARHFRESPYTSLSPVLGTAVLTAAVVLLMMVSVLSYYRRKCSSNADVPCVCPGMQIQMQEIK